MTHHLTSSYPITTTPCHQGQGHQVVERVFCLLDNPYVLKSLAYMRVDVLLIDLSPELAN
jgi:hypothetical protein